VFLAELLLEGTASINKMNSLHQNANSLHLPKRKGVELNLLTRGTGIPVYDKRAHAAVVSQFTYLLVHFKKLPVF